MLGLLACPAVLVFTVVTQRRARDRDRTVRAVERVIAQFNGEVGIDLPPAVEAICFRGRETQVGRDDRCSLRRLRNWIRETVERLQVDRLGVKIV
jgi:hypothetical protein